MGYDPARRIGDDGVDDHNLLEETAEIAEVGLTAVERQELVGGT